MSDLAALFEELNDHLYPKPQTPLAKLPSGIFRTIVADPPWEVKFGSPRTYSPAEGDGGWNLDTKIKALDYPIMSTHEIAAMPVASVTDKDAHLYLWTINSNIEQAYSVARAWGFKPSTLLTWCKAPMGLGLGGIFCNTTEYILFARRGSLEAKRRVCRTWWNWPREKHSEKPEMFQTIVETVSPGPYLELFARRKRPGWVTWGNEIK